MKLGSPREVATAFVVHLMAKTSKSDHIFAPLVSLRLMSAQKFFDMQEEFFGMYGEPVMIFFSHPENVCSAAFRVRPTPKYKGFARLGSTSVCSDGRMAFESTACEL